MPPVRPVAEQESTSQPTLVEPPIATTKRRLEMPLDPPVTSGTPAIEADQEQIVKEFLEKFGRGAQVSAIYARLAEVCRTGEAAATTTQAVTVKPPSCSASEPHSESPARDQMADQPQMAKTPIKESPSPATHADTQATTQLLVPDSTLVDEAGNQRKERDQDVHDEEIPDVTGEPEQETAGSAEEEGLVDNDEGNVEAEEEGVAESKGNREAEEEVEEEVEGQGEAEEEAEEEREENEEKVAEPEGEETPVGKKEMQRQK